MLVRSNALEKPPLQNTHNHCCILPNCCILPKHSQTNILDLPPEMVEKIFHKFTSIQDVTNCSIALAGTRHEEFATQNYLKSQLKIFASLDLNLKESLRNEGWFEALLFWNSSKLITRSWKEFKPCLPGMFFWLT